MSNFADQLVLARWVFQQLGVEGFEPLQKLLCGPEFEGWAEDGGTYFVQQLLARLPKEAGRTVSTEMLRVCRRADAMA